MDSMDKKSTAAPSTGSQRAAKLVLPIHTPQDNSYYLQYMPRTDVSADEIASRHEQLDANNLKLTKVLVSNLPDYMDEPLVREVFRLAGKIIKIEFIPQSCTRIVGKAYVTYASQEAADRAVRLCRRLHNYYDKPISIRIICEDIGMPEQFGEAVDIFNKPAELSLTSEHLFEPYKNLSVPDKQKLKWSLITMKKSLSAFDETVRKMRTRIETHIELKKFRLDTDVQNPMYVPGRLAHEEDDDNDNDPGEVKITSLINMKAHK